MWKSLNKVYFKLLKKYQVSSSERNYWVIKIKTLSCDNMNPTKNTRIKLLQNILN